MFYVRFVSKRKEGEKFCGFSQMVIFRMVKDFSLSLLLKLLNLINYFNLVDENSSLFIGSKFSTTQNNSKR
jgi:hypothetical protein